jgi:hypothetical protein
MSDPRLSDFGVRLRAAETKYAHHIKAASAREMDRQIEACGHGVGHVYITVVDGQHFVSPVYPGRNEA